MENRKRGVLITIVIILVTLTFIFFYKKDTNSKEELINKAINIALENGDLPDYDFVKNYENIIVSSENLDNEILPEVLSKKLIVMTPYEIKEKANKEGDFLYLTFKNISIDNQNASIVIENTWAISDNSKETYLSGGGIKVKFHKSFGAWKENSTREVWLS
ncbi:hypothetical protein [Clostridium intestinale]|uniref:hypothetical protein n=1 Tax=Clostridium intestinale TaxID=36845 RepID=UPI0028E6B9D2|nr:hypothetical protein [Clostridium intestinale]